MSTIPSLSAPLLFAVGAMVGALGALSFRSGIRALGFWFFAWAVHLVGKSFVLLGAEPLPTAIATLASAGVAPLMVAGARVHAGRTVPVWLAGATGLLIVVRVGSQAAGLPAGDHGMALIVEPLLAFYASRLVLSNRKARGLTRRDGFLAAAFVLYGACEAVDATLGLTGSAHAPYVWTWVFLGMPLFACQSMSHMQSERDRARLDARRSHEQSARLRILTGSRSTIVLEYDAFGRITYVGDHLPGQDASLRERLIGRNAFEFLDSAPNSPLRRALEEKGYIAEEDLASDEPTTIPIKRPNGTTRYYEAYREHYHTREDELRIVAQAHDVTERIERENATREIARRLARAEAIGRFGSWEFQIDTSETVWSDELYRIHGLDPELGRITLPMIQTLIHPDDLQEYRERIATLARDGRFPEFQHRIIRADSGEIRFLRSVGEVEYDEEGHPVRVNGASIDVTHQEELDQTIQRGRRYLDALFDSDIMCVFYGDVSGRMTDANEALLGLLGYTRSDLPLDWRDLTPPELHERDRAGVLELQQTGVALPYEKEFFARSGHRIPVQIACVRIEEDRAIAIVVDLSERKRNEAFVAAQRRELERAVAARTLELSRSRSRLNEAQRLATVGTLAAGVAHQINNPLGAILTSAEYALLRANETRDDEAAPILQDALETNLEEARRCARIVKSMLQFSRDEPTVKWQEDLAGVIQHAHRAISAYAKDRGATVTLHPFAGPLPAIVSPIEIEQAIVNVLRNAIESKDRDASVELSVTRRDKRVAIEIADDGRGMNEDDLDRLFEPFFSTRTTQGGTGLGLSVAHGVIKDHGGEIRVDSVLGEGTRVILELPLEDRKLDG